MNSRHGCWVSRRSRRCCFSWHCAGFGTPDTLVGPPGGLYGATLMPDKSVGRTKTAASFGEGPNRRGPCGGARLWAMPEGRRLIMNGMTSATHVWQVITSGHSHGPELNPHRGGAAQIAGGSPGRDPRRADFHGTGRRRPEVAVTAMPPGVSRIPAVLSLALEVLERASTWAPAPDRNQSLRRPPQSSRPPSPGPSGSLRRKPTWRWRELAWGLWRLLGRISPGLALSGGCGPGAAGSDPGMHP